MILAIYGTAGTGREVHDLACDILRCEPDRWSELVFLDDFTDERNLYGSKILPFEAFSERYATDEAEVIICVGEPSARKLLWERVTGAGYKLATLVHPLALVSPHAHLGAGVCVRAGSQVCADATLKDNVFVQACAIVGHDVVVGSHTQISAFAHISGNVTLGECCYLGVHCSIRDECKMGDNVVLGMGAMVMERRVPSNVMAVGNPAKYVRRKAGSKVFE